MSALYQPQQRVFVKPEGEFGNIVQVCGHKKGLWLYEVKIDSQDTYVFADESELLLPGDSSIQYYIGSRPPHGGYPTPVPGSTDDFEAPLPIELEKPKCECGLHAIDASRMVGHASWCPIGANR